jgi:hypothetical protein
MAFLRWDILFGLLMLLPDALDDPIKLKKFYFFFAASITAPGARGGLFVPSCFYYVWSSLRNSCSLNP